MALEEDQDPSTVAGIDGLPGLIITNDGVSDEDVRGLNSGVHVIL